MHSLIAEELSRVREREIRAGLQSYRAIDGDGRRHDGDRIVIRRSAPGDGAALSALATLDDREWCGGSALVAEVDGTLLAALPLDAGRSFADPFRPSTEAVALLELRAKQLGRALPSRRRPRWAFAR